MIVFFLLAYGLTWMLQIPAVIFPDWPDLLSFLGSFGPVVAAFIVAGLIAGKDGVQQLITPIRKWRVGIQWYLIVLLGPSLMMVISIYLYRLLGKGSGISAHVHISSMIGEHFLVLFIILSIRTSLFGGKKSVGEALPCQVCKKNITRFWLASLVLDRRFCSTKHDCAILYSGHSRVFDSLYMDLQWRERQFTADISVTCGEQYVGILHNVVFQANH